VLVAADAPTTLRVDNRSQLMKYFSLNQDKTTYEKTYDPTDVKKNLSASVNGTTPNFTSDLTFPVELTVFDSLGSKYTLVLYFAKLNSNEWAVELVSQKKADGSGFDATNAKENGLIKQGTIKFDTNGKLLAGSPDGLSGPITISRDNGSSPSNITIDWENTMSEITSGSVTQTKNDE
jgi:hypothetical protein